MKSLIVWRSAKETSTTDSTEDSSLCTGKMLADELSISILDYSVGVCHNRGGFTGFSTQPYGETLMKFVESFWHKLAKFRGTEYCNKAFNSLWRRMNILSVVLGQACIVEVAWILSF